MKAIWLLLIHLLTAGAKRLGSGGINGIIAENLLLKQLLLVLSRTAHRICQRSTDSARALL
jgi:hypothetical protein